jgi:hypothetical protein
MFLARLRVCLTTQLVQRHFQHWVGTSPLFNSEGAPLQTSQLLKKSFRLLIGTDFSGFGILSDPKTHAPSCTSASAERLKDSAVSLKDSWLQRRASIA